MRRSLGRMSLLLPLALLAACGADKPPPFDAEITAGDCQGYPLVAGQAADPVAGAEDIAVWDNRRLVLSAYDRRAAARAVKKGIPPPEGGIYVLTRERLAEAPVQGRIVLERLSPPVPLRPHGIAAAKDGRGVRLYVIDRRLGGTVPAVRIWAFALSAGPRPALRQPRLLAEGPAWCAANDLTPAPDGRSLLVTLDHRACSGPARLKEDALKAASGRITRLPLDRDRPSRTPEETELSGLVWPNGIALEEEGAARPAVWIAETRRRALTAWRPGTPGGLRRVALPAAPDNLSPITHARGSAEGGGLVIAAHPSLIALALYRDHLFGRTRAPSLILRFTERKGLTTLYAGDGSRISAATTALLWGDRLVATSAWDRRMLVCRVSPAQRGAREPR